MEVNVDFNGMERVIPFADNYSSFISEIKNTFNLKDDECSRLNFTFNFVGDNVNFDFIVSNENEYMNSKEFAINLKEINASMELKPKKKNSQKIKINNQNNQNQNFPNKNYQNQNNQNQNFPNKNYQNQNNKNLNNQNNQNQYYQNQNNQNQNFQNKNYQNQNNQNQNFRIKNDQYLQNNENDLDEEIKRLQKQKEKLLHKIDQIKKENQKYEKKQKQKKDNIQIEEAIKRLTIMEKSESKPYKEEKRNNELKVSGIPEIIKIKNINSLPLNCEFLDNKIKLNHTIEIEKNKISPQNPIIYFFRIKNNGEQVWPDDTLLKCEVDDSEIYFYYVSINDNNDAQFIVLKNGDNFQQFKIRVLFKNYGNIIEGNEYQLRAYLLSDKSGRIGNDYGYLTIKVLPSKSIYYNRNDSNQDNFTKAFVEDY